MKILASGCSFTAGWPTPGANWPVKLGRKFKVKNLAMSSAGNRYIGQSITLELIKESFAYDIVLVMWSGLQRMDLMVNDLVYDMLDRNKASVGNRWCYSLLGDAYTHKYSSEVTKTAAMEIFKISNEEINGCNSLLEMINLQSFLKSNRIPYRFMSYINYWNDEPMLKNLNFGVYKYQSCRELAEQLDFDNFIFYNDSKDGFYEFGLDQNLIADDRFHPTIEAHVRWADFIREKI